MDGEPITIAAVGGSVTGAHEHAALLSRWVHAGYGRDWSCCGKALDILPFGRAM